MKRNSFKRKLPLGKLIIVLLVLAIVLVQCSIMKNKNTKDEFVSNNNKEYKTTEKVSDKEAEKAQEEHNKEMLKKLEEYNKQEEARRKEQERLDRLQNAEIITMELEKVSKLICYEGKTIYKDTVVKGFFAKNKLSLNITYKFGVAFDLNKIVVDEIINDVAVIKIPNEFVLEYVEELTDQSFVNGKKNWFAKDFTPEENDFIRDYAKEKVVERINSTPIVFEKADESLKDTIEKLVMKLGYSKVIFKN